MAVSQVEEKILGRIAKQTAPDNPLLSGHLYQVLGLSIMLSRKLYRAGRLRKLDTTRDTKSLQLYHQIIWLAREGLSITEVCILPYCRNGENGPLCRVMAAKLRASLYHVLCLFHNRPSVSAVSPGTPRVANSPSNVRTPKGDSGHGKRSPGGSQNGSRSNGKRQRTDNIALRDPVPSTASDASYITNLWAGPARTPPPLGPPPPTPPGARRTPRRPPGLTSIDLSASQAAEIPLHSPRDFVPTARSNFDTVQHLATSLLAPTHALRLSVSLEHCAFLWECEKEYDGAVRLARRTIKQVYDSTEGLDDEEFTDASLIVQALAGIVRRGKNGVARTPSRELPPTSKQQTVSHTRGPVDRTIAVSPTNRGARIQSPAQRGSIMRTPERLSTVPEVESIDATSESQTLAALSPPVSRLSSRSRQGRTSSASAASDKPSKRRVVEQAEELFRRNSSSNQSSGARSRQATPHEEGLSGAANHPSRQPRRTSSALTCAEDRRDAVLRALEIVSSVSNALNVPGQPRFLHA
ncbi:hypothetical protein BAUCODRAFT_188244 [Baudoinia panamericana UAMH 10762]|uniref:14-3-3 domain-containing protein n=1 Tax=Baudoinia panamericana (strain UAMH 10762) TaxID=717646 RepID=M2NNT9_BAUPA|nr:uncharacterized protein BAUCODRAFT_188244 [Baudoinia panamericana UAMH 10762]EMD00901.1 hypothetical protein BAUCODRAFT_188244 [Baudoinia panamericana UAMH 10762]